MHSEGFIFPVGPRGKRGTEMLAASRQPASNPKKNTLCAVIMEPKFSKQYRRVWIGFIWLRVWGKWRVIVKAVMNLQVP